MGKSRSKVSVNVGHPSTIDRSVLGPTDPTPSKSLKEVSRGTWTPPPKSLENENVESGT